ncbi:putative Transposon Tf2-6 polyprotein-like 4 [Homarus americanus]|uniref:Putative Transposon Tf2-6 polyprotein-like 4 n=1 Tax=Homarus americanus TaxID=6706 RepID=A0A8J5MMQ6_HOMAM|nr:putative Transposon Tf2-6 polyprotein-like 4 [Homarus americanus]
MEKQLEKLTAFLMQQAEMAKQAQLESQPREERWSQILERVVSQQAPSHHSTTTTSGVAAASKWCATPGQVSPNQRAALVSVLDDKRIRILRYRVGVADDTELEAYLRGQGNVIVDWRDFYSRVQELGVYTNRVSVRPAPQVVVDATHPAGRDTVVRTPFSVAEATVMGFDIVKSLVIYQSILDPSASAGLLSAEDFPAQIQPVKQSKLTSDRSSLPPGVIRASSPTLLVVLPRPTYPVRSPHDVVASIGSGACLITTMESKMGYFQVKIEDEDQDFTCFITPWGRFKFKRAVMGIVSSGDEYNRHLRRRDEKMNQDIVDPQVVPNVLGEVRDVYVMRTSRASEPLCGMNERVHECCPLVA